MKNINQKTIQTKLKDGYTIDAFLDELSMDKEQFFFELGLIYSEENLQDIKKKLAKNAKKKPKRGRCIRQEAFVEEMPLQLSDSLLSKKLALSKVISKIKNKEEEIDELQSCLSNTNDEIDCLKATIDRTDKSIYELQQQLDCLQEKMDDALAELDCKKILLSSISSKLQTCTEQLENLIQQKACLEMVSLFVYANGAIEANDVLLSDSDIPADWTTIHQSLFGCDVVDCLTGFECKTLAKLLAYVRALTTYEICFESEDLQACFEILQEEKAEEA